MGPRPTPPPLPFAHPFHPTRGIRQGSSDAPTAFDLVIDCVLREWHHQMLNRKFELFTSFYADDGRLAGFDNPEQVQIGLDVYADLFGRLGLQLNSDKTKFMVTYGRPLSHPESESAYRHRFDPSTPSAYTRAHTSIPCPLCSKPITQQHLSRHMERMHDTFPSTIPSLVPVSRSSITYHVSMPTHIAPLSCPVPSCPGSAMTRQRMHAHFVTRHPHDRLEIAEEGPLHQCPRCGIHTRMMGSLYYRIKHFRTKTCQQRAAQRAVRAKYEQQVRFAETVQFYLYGNQPIKRVFEYRYLGRILRYDDTDTRAVNDRLNLAKAKWGRLSKVLVTTNSNPKVMARFYLAVVQAILLYGSESWVIPSRTLQRIEAFHHRCARSMAHKHIRKMPNGNWEYPPSEQVLRICGLRPIKLYIQRRKVTLKRTYAEKHSSLYQRCKTLPHTCSSVSHPVWWR